MDLEELEIKTERIASMLVREGLSAVILNAQHNFSWFTGGASNGIDLSRENGAGSLLITRSGRRYLLADNIEMPRLLAEEVLAADFEPVEFNWREPALDRARGLSGGDIATDVPMFHGVASVEPAIAKCRFQLTKGELQRYRTLGRDAGEAMMRVIADLTPGETEMSVAGKLNKRFRLAEMTPVVTLVGADERIERFRHPIPTEKIWTRTLLIVTCARRHGLIVSLSRILCAGEVSAELQRRTDAAAFVNAAMLDATRPGTTAADLYAAADKAYSQMGFAGEIDLHHQGGAAGYKPREWVAHPNSSEVVLLDQAFAWNPSITGTKVEETVITTDTGVQAITSSPDFPQIITHLGGREYVSPGVLSI